jgi:hypothetical protein
MAVFVGAVGLHQMSFVLAGTDDWNADDGNWSVAGNWNPASVPGAGDDVSIAFSDLVNRTINYDYTGAPVALDSLTLDMTNFSGGNSGTASSVLTMSANNLTANTEYLGNSGSGSFIQTGGSNSITGSVFDSFQDKAGLIIARYSGSQGSYSLSGGMLSVVEKEIVGEQGNGTFIETGGTNSAAYLFLANADGRTSTYTLSGTGSLSVSGGESIGSGGTGIFMQSGGTNTISINALALGENGLSNTGTGIYNLSGGCLSSATIVIGAQEPGILNQTGGAVGSSNLIDFGESQGATGTYSLSSTGTLTAHDVKVGDLGSGTFTQTGGISTISSILLLGVNAGSTGIFTISGGTSTVSGNVGVGGSATAAGGTGILTVNDAGELAIAGTVQIYSEGQFNLNGGTASAAVLNLAGGYSQTGGTATFGQIIGNGPVAISGGLTTLSVGGGASQLSSLIISGTGTLDITQGNTLAVDYGAAIDPSATIRGYLKTAYNGGVWTGAGLTSSVVQAQVVATIAAHTGGVYGIGYADGSDVSQLPVVAVGRQLVYEPALIGDANLDGSVNFIDLGIVAQNLGGINTDWEHGDFNYDGTTNFLDIGLLAQNLSKTILNTPLGEMIPDPSAELTAQWNLAVAEIQANSLEPTNLPEPAMVGMLAVGVGGMLARRRRSKERLQALSA